ncbi:hypothetical protein BDN72DRAFT_906385 [Pluteus cervinus]|uniref:Uncharacterized protein n=1 Tax=Pluteus cervinus TaxID=181527 RepID=A0ACD2ZZU1_9AGAR|nr:hypothetical protein BDN72DRAFT_906385 [Pluteus cervinus]
MRRSKPAAVLTPPLVTRAKSKLNDGGSTSGTRSQSIIVGSSSTDTLTPLTPSSDTTPRGLFLPLDTPVLDLARRVPVKFWYMDGTSSQYFFHPQTNGVVILNNHLSSTLRGSPLNLFIPVEVYSTEYHCWLACHLYTAFIPETGLLLFKQGPDPPDLHQYLNLHPGSDWAPLAENNLPLTFSGFEASSSQSDASPVPLVARTRKAKGRSTPIRSRTRPARSPSPQGIPVQYRRKGKERA